MSVVVSDTSPLRAIHHLRLLGLLEDFYGQVFIPPAVARELEFPKSRAIPIIISHYPVMVLRHPKSRELVARFSQSLDAGESEAIALAIEIDADLLIMDEKSGRDAAVQAGIAHVGVIGILQRAKKERLIENLRPYIDQLRNEINFFISDRLYEQILQSAQEE